MSDTTLINRAAVVRLYPNREQAAALRRWQGGLRFVWNNTSHLTAQRPPLLPKGPKK